jgi:hypothetical protein
MDPPNKIDEMCALFDASDIRLVQWWESAGRARADKALDFTLSWYEDINFDALTTTMIGSKVLEDPEMKKKKQDRAYAMV